MSFVLLKSNTKDRQEVGDVVVNTAFIEAVRLIEVAREGGVEFLVRVDTTDNGYNAAFHTLEDAKEMISKLTSASADLSEMLPMVECKEKKAKKAALEALKTLMS